MENSANVEIITKTVKYRDLLSAFAARTDCEEQILLVLHKLNKLNMDLDILKATGVGKVVNSLKLKGGAIAKFAIQLVNKWRSMVDAIDESKTSESQTGSGAKKSHKNSHHNVGTNNKVDNTKINNVGNNSNSGSSSSTNLNSNGVSNLSGTSKQKSKLNSINGSAGKDDEIIAKTAEKNRITDKTDQNLKKVSVEKSYNSGATNNDNCTTYTNLNNMKYNSLKDVSKIEKTSHNKSKEKKQPETGKSSMPSTPVPTQKVSKVDVNVVKKISPTKSSTNNTSMKTETVPTVDKANKKQKNDAKKDPKTSKFENPSFKSEAEGGEKKAKKRKHDGDDEEDKDEFDNNGENDASNTGSFMDFCNYSYSSTINQKKKARTSTTSCDNNKVSAMKNTAKPNNSNTNFVSKSISNKSTSSAREYSNRSSSSSETEMEINKYLKDLSSQSAHILNKMKEGEKSQCDSPYSMDLQSLEPYEPGLRSNHRSLVFCGKRTAPIHTEVLTLRQLCQKVLYDHIDYVEHVGLAPYHLMEPILKKCTASQLEKFEFYNQQMISETDKLWMNHCKKAFPNRKPDEMETWREVYMDGQEERKAKLEKCVEVIGASSAKVKNEVNKLKFIDACIVPTRRRGGWGSQQTSASNFNGGRPKPGNSLASSKGGQKQVGHLMKKTLQMIGAKRR